MSCLADAIAAMFCAWNETDEQRIREHAAQSLTRDIEFTDPGNRVRGSEQWIQMVKAFRAGNPEARPRLAGLSTNTTTARVMHGRWSSMMERNLKG